MRTLLISIAALGLAACPETREEAQARSELERIELEREAGAAADAFSSIAPSADAEDASGGGEPQAGSCAAITDAETFVRCLYEGTASGSVRTGQEPDGPMFLSDRYWRTVQQMRAAGPGWANMDPLCLCTTPGAMRLSRARIGAPIDNGAAVEIVLEQNGQMGNLRVELLRSDDGWRVNNVVAHSG